MSYNPGNFYSSDQIIFDPSDSRDLLNFNNEVPLINSNSMSNINNIRSMETRLLKKINNIRPSCNQNPYCVQYPNDPSLTDYDVKLFSPEGAYIEQKRMDIRNNIEDYYFGDRYYKPSDACKNRPPRDCNNPQSEHFLNQIDGNMHGIDDLYDNRINYSNGKSDVVRKKNNKKEKMSNSCRGTKSTNLLNNFCLFDNNIIYIFLILCVFIIVNQNNNIIYLNKIIANISKNIPNQNSEDTG